MRKLNRSDVHDRFQFFTKQGADIGECCQDLIDQRPFGDHPFYIFVHTRTADDGVNKRMIWQPRLTKPKAETNSMLFKGYPGTDNVKIIWMIPVPEMWAQFKSGTLFENQIIVESIAAFEKEPQKLEAPEQDDLSDEEINAIYVQISREAKRKKASAALN